MYTIPRDCIRVPGDLPAMCKVNAISVVGELKQVFKKNKKKLSMKVYSSTSDFYTDTLS